MQHGGLRRPGELARLGLSPWPPRLSHARLAAAIDRIDKVRRPEALVLPGDHGWEGNQLEGRPSAGVGVRLATTGGVARGLRLVCWWLGLAVVGMVVLCLM